MAKSLKVQALRNITSNWFGLGVSIAVGFFISPFILHKLGDDAFGLWVLIFSLTGYYGLFDLGIRSSIIKYVAKYFAVRDYEQLSRMINTSLFSYTCVAAVLLAFTFAGSWYVDSIFHVTPEFLRTARLLFLMVGAAVSVGFPLSVFSGVLQGLQQFHWLNLAQVITNLFRALLIVIVLEHGMGLLAIALITVGLPVVASSSYILVVRHLIPVRFGTRFIDRRTFRQLISYGAVTFMAIVADRLRFQSDAMIIGIFLSASAITYFSIGSKLVDYSNNVVDSMADTFMPMSSHFDATGEDERMRQLFIAGNRACALVIFPICAILLILGKSVIEVWMGHKYVATSYVVLVLLIVPRTIYRSQGASTRILFGMARHRALAMILLGEAITNVALSIVLIRPFGIIGDAVGTAVPMLATSVFFLPYYLCRLLKVRIRDFLSRAFLPPLGIVGPLVAVLLLMRHWFYAHTYLQLLEQLLAGGIVYAAGLLWFFFTKEPMGMKLRARCVEFLQHAFSR